jgi:hypothetical protein
MKATPLPVGWLSIGTLGCEGVSPGGMVPTV